MRDLEKKIEIYQKYNDEQGLTLSKKEQDKLFGPAYDTVQAETMLSL